MSVAFNAIVKRLWIIAWSFPTLIQDVVAPIRHAKHRNLILLGGSKEDLISKGRLKGDQKENRYRKGDPKASVNSDQDQSLAI